MTKFSRASGDFRGRAMVCLWVALAAVCVMMAPMALAAPRPLRYSEARAAAPRHIRARRMTVQDSQAGSAQKSSKAGAKAGKAKTGTASAAHAAKPSAQASTKLKSKSKHRKLRPEDEADNDPLVIHRVARRGRRLRRDVPRQSIAARRVAKETTLANTADTGPEIFDRGQSHPDDDERLPVTSGQQIVAEVSAAPEPVTPVGKTTLPEKLRTATMNAESKLSGRGRADVLPEDHEGKVAVIDQAMQPMVLPTLYMRHGRVVMPPPLKGTRDILVHQNTMADNEGLDRIQNDEDLDRMRDLHLLVPLTDTAALRVNEGLPENRRYARPWAVRFAADTSRAFYSRFHQPLQLNSAVRTVDYQLRLQRVNGNAAAVDGDGASPHLTGQALDFGKRGLSKMEIAWMRAYLAPLMQAGKVDVEEEFQQACFHISIYRSYAPILLPKPKAATKVEVARAEVPASE